MIFQVPPKFEGFGGVFDIDRLKHYNQPFGYDAQKNLDDQDNINTINPAAFLTDDEEKVFLKLNHPTLTFFLKLFYNLYKLNVYIFSL